MFDCHVLCHARDLLDEGIEPILDCLQGQMGASGLTLWIASDERPPHFRPHRAAEPRVQYCPGGLFFIPSAERFEATRIKPPIAVEARRRDLLAHASEHCVSRGLELRAALQPLHCARVAGRHPEFAAKNAFGWHDRHKLCPNNPDVRAYLLALAADLSTYDGVSDVVLELGDVGSALRIPSHLGQIADLLDLCYCESCLQQAAEEDIDADAALRGTRAVLERACAHGPGELRGAEDKSVQCYRQWSRLRRAGVLGDFKRSLSKSVALVFPDPAIPDDALAVVADRLLVYLPDHERALRCDLPCELLATSLAQPDADGPTLIQEVTRGIELGLSALNIGDYAAVAEWQLDWIRQAVRHARRISNPQMR